MSIHKLVVLIAAFILASFLGSTTAGAAVNPACDPILFPTDDCDGDGIPNSVDTCDNLDPLADCDGDEVPNGVDECPDTVAGTPLVLGDTTCVASGLDTVLPSGCSLSESLAEELLECAQGVTNHGKFVSCVAKKLNALKKAKVISGNQKGQLQSCAAQSNIGQKTKPPKH